MSIERKLIGTVDATGSGPVYVEDVFSTWLYDGTGASQTINNGIDLATKGGLVWCKNRNASGITSHILFDTARGRDNRLSSNLTDGQSTGWSDYFNFTNTGFEFPLGDNQINPVGQNFVSWTFRKQAKFFDVVTYTGDGTNGREIAHALGVTPGMIIQKRASGISYWNVWHRGLASFFGSNLQYKSGLYLNTTDANNGIDLITAAPTASSINIAGGYNQSGETYVAYLFADSNSGGFGPAGTDSVVACGSFTASSLTSVSLGWEPQFVLLKKSTFVSDWYLLDTMRGLDQTNSQYLRANSSSIEGSNPTPIIPTATGFNYSGTNFNDTSGTYIYLAIRRGPMKTPTDATKVFAPVAYAGDDNTTRTIASGFPADFVIRSTRTTGFKHYLSDRLRGALELNTTVANAEGAASVSYDVQSGLKLTTTGVGYNSSSYNYIHQMFRRAPGFFDVVCYTGTGANRTVSHNLGVAPELMIIKSRSYPTGWNIYSAILGNTKLLYLNTSSAQTDATAWNSTNPTSAVFSTGDGSNVANNESGGTYVAYLFATCPGVSKVFSYTGNGSSQTIDCGFTSGARFVLIKRTDSTGDWWVYDSARGIVSAADPALRLNSTAAEVTSADAIDPASSGFIVNQEATCNVNVNNATYIGLAIA